MPEKRAPGQKQVLVLFREAFLREIDSKLNGLGYDDRASFIRTAVYEKLERMGITLPREFMTAPDRAGKGGPTVNYGIQQSGMNNTASISYAPQHESKKSEQRNPAKRKRKSSGSA